MLLVFIMLVWSTLAFAEEPARYYVCGNEERVLWTLESRRDLSFLAGSAQCRSPFLLVVIKDDQLDAQRTMGAQVPARYMRLVDGLMVMKSEKEQRSVDAERQQRMQQQRGLRPTQQAAGTVRYTQKGGSNNASCSQGSPCATIQHGISTLQPGDTLVVGPGAWSETPQTDKDNITLKGVPGARPLLKPPSGTSVILSVPTSASGVTIDGFEIDGSNHTSSFCVWTSDGVFDVTVKNSIIKNCKIQGVLASQGDGHRYENNLFLNNGVGNDLEHNLYINGPGHVVTGNYFTGAVGYNMQCSQHGGCRESIIEGNTWTGSNKGMTIDSNGSNVVRNNIFAHDSIKDGPTKCARAQGAGGTKFLYNTYVRCGAYIRNDSPNTEVAYSIFADGSKITNETATNAHDNIFTDPGLTGPPPTPGDPGYRLTAGATAAIGKAPCIPQVPNDIDGQTRPQGGSCDLGADEYMVQGPNGPDPSPTHHLAWIVDPKTTQVGAPFTPAPVMHVHAGDHSLVTTSTAAVTMTAVGCGTLACGPQTCTRTSVGGVTTWDGLTLSAEGTKCTLQATAALLGGSDTEVSAAFTVTPAPPVTDPGLPLGECVATKSGDKQTTITCTQP